MCSEWDCLMYEPTCEACFVQTHASCPMHWAQVWNGEFFERKDISDLSPGYVLTLGHPVLGQRCHRADYGKTFEFIVVDVNGVHKTRVVFCECRKSTVRRFHHCLQSKIFPSTVKHPSSGFTFAVLRDFHQQTLTSKKSPYDYIQAILCKGNNAFPQDPPVCHLEIRSLCCTDHHQDMYSQFLRVQRVWRALSNIKRSGQAHKIDNFFPFRPRGSVIVPCFSCPEPGFNVSLTEIPDGSTIDGFEYVRIY